MQKNRADAAINLNTVLSKSLDKYFQMLGKTGHSNSEDVYNLMIVSIIHNILTKYYNYIENDDFRSIYNIMDRAENSCFIGRILSPNDDDLFRGIERDLITRVTEEDVVRITEQGLLKIIN